MWQIVAKKTDLEGYIDLETKADINSHDDANTITPFETDIVNRDTDDGVANPTPGPRPRVY